METLEVIISEGDGDEIIINIELELMAHIEEHSEKCYSETNSDYYQGPIVEFYTALLMSGAYAVRKEDLEDIPHYLIIDEDYETNRKIIFH